MNNKQKDKLEKYDASLKTLVVPIQK